MYFCKRMPLTVYYDEACPRCLWGVRILKYVAGGRLRILPLRAAGPQHRAIDMQRAVQAMPVLSATGRIWYGFDAYMAIIRHIRWLWPLWPLGFVLQYTGLGAKAYTYFALRRKVIICHNATPSPPYLPHKHQQNRHRCKASD